MSDVSGPFIFKPEPMPEGIEVGPATHEFSSEDVKNRFGFHKDAGVPEHEDLRLAWLEFAEYLDYVLPAGRAKDEMFNYLETASMWSHKTLAAQATGVNREKEKN